MKSITFTPKQETEIVNLYTTTKIGVVALGVKFGVSRTVIKRILGANGVSLKNMVECHLGQPAWNKGKHWSEEVKAKLSAKAKGREGDKNPNWKGGMMTTRDKRRNLGLVTKWRKLCLNRDGYVCLWCGSNDKLEVNHIIPIRDITDLNLLGDLENGITLCRKCHNKVHYHEYEYTDIFRKLLKNRVNSGNI